MSGEYERYSLKPTEHHPADMGMTEMEEQLIFLFLIKQFDIQSCKTAYTA